MKVNKQLVSLDKHADALGLNNSKTRSIANNMFELVTITAENGYLTQTQDVPIEQRTFASEITLSKNYSVENYKEISVEEFNVLKAQQREYFKKQMEEMTNGED